MSLSITYDLYLKAVLVGDAGVGKTSVWHRVLHGEYSEKYIITICADIQTRDFTVDGYKVRFTLMDTAGQEKFRFMGNLYYKEKELVIMVFDLTQPRTFDSLCNDWVFEVMNNCDPDRTTLLVLGNKLDAGEPALTPAEVRQRLETIQRCRLVSVEGSEGQSAKSANKDAFEYMYCEVSAKSGQGVLEGVEQAVRRIAKRKLRNKPRVNVGNDFGDSQLLIDGKELRENTARPNNCC